MQHMYTTASYGQIKRPAHERYWRLLFEDEGGQSGTVAYAINWDELYQLKGRLLTLIDAMFADPEQRKAFKDVTSQLLRDWMEGIEAQSAASVSGGQDSKEFEQSPE